MGANPEQEEETIVFTNSSFLTQSYPLDFIYYDRSRYTFDKECVTRKVTNFIVPNLNPPSVPFLCYRENENKNKTEKNGKEKVFIKNPVLVFTSFLGLLERQKNYGQRGTEKDSPNFGPTFYNL